MKRENVLIAIGSLILSLLLWLQLQPLFDPDKEREFQVPLEIEGLPETLMVTNGPVAVTLVASGTTSDLDRLTAQSVRAYIDLRRVEPGNNTVLVQVSAPITSNITLRARTVRLNINVERVEETRQQVQFETTGVPPAEYLFDGASILPESVVVRGPASLIPRVKMVRVLLDLSRIRPSGTYPLPVEILDETGKPVPWMTCEPVNVSVSPAVAPAPAARSVLITPTWTGQPSFGYEVVSYEIRPMQAKLKGESRDLSSITTIATEPISLEGATADLNLRVKLKVPEGVSPDVREVRVVVKIAKAPTSPNNTPPTNSP